MKIKRLIALFLIASLTLCFSCVYYNTFYHAQKSFKHAEKSQKKAGRQIASSEEKKNYDDAINKASKVLTFYPKSKWADDALLIIGMSFYYQGEYAKAERKFTELVSSFPRSKFLHQARFYGAMCQYRLGEYSDAISSLKLILSDPKNKESREEVYFTLGQIYFQQKRYDDAIENYQILMKKYDKSGFLAEAQYKIGESFLEKKDYAQAQDAFGKVKDFKPSKELLFNSIFEIGKCYYLMDKVSSGIEVLNKLTKDERFYEKLPLVKLKIAEGWHLLSKNEQAIKEYEEITVSYPKTEEAAAAYYHLGVIYEENINDLKKAKDMFDKSKDQKSNSDYARKALEKSASLAKVDEYKKQLTVAEAEDPAKTMFLLAELYLTQVNQPDSALAEYLALVENHPQSEYAPKSLYAAAWVLQNVKEDSLTASKVYQRILIEYPKSDYAKSACGFLKQSPSKGEICAEDEYLRAERMLLAEGKIDSAVALYQKIVQDYPNSEYASKASYAVAWAKENFISTSDSSAALAYQEVVDKYPETEYASQAKLKLGLTTRPKPAQIIPLPAETAQVALADTGKPATDTSLYSVPLAPTPLRRGIFVYPQTERDTGIQGKVVLKVKIDYHTGRVTEANVLGSLSNYNIDEAARKAALTTFFSPDSFKVSNQNGYFLYQVEVKPYNIDQQ
jgi:TonB family protein